MRTVCEKIQSFEEKEWRERIWNNKKLTWYRRIKNNLKFEDYLQDEWVQGRRILCQLRGVLSV